MANFTKKQELSDSPFSNGLVWVIQSPIIACVRFITIPAWKKIKQKNGNS